MVPRDFLYLCRPIFSTKWSHGDIKDILVANCHAALTCLQNVTEYEFYCLGTKRWRASENTAHFIKLSFELMIIVKSFNKIKENKQSQE